MEFIWSLIYLTRATLWSFDDDAWSIIYIRLSVHVQMYFSVIAFFSRMSLNYLLECTSIFSIRFEVHALETFKAIPP